MGRRSDDYHIRGDSSPCPATRRFTWNGETGDVATCMSCGRDYPDHVRSEEMTTSGRSRWCVICQEDHG